MKDQIEISKYSPCREALKYRLEHPDFKEAWENCPRGDWMLWIAQKAGVDIHPLTYAKAKCAETVKHLMKDERSLNAIKVAKKFGKKKAARKELDAAYTAAYTAANDAYTAYTAYTAAYTTAATAAAYTADAYAATAAAAADADADAAYTAADAYAAYTDADDARHNNRKKTADICRKHLTKHVFKALNIK